MIMFDRANGGKRHADGAGLDSSEYYGFVRERVQGHFSALQIVRRQACGGDGTAGCQFGGTAAGAKHIPGCDELRPRSARIVGQPETVGAQYAVIADDHARTGGIGVGGCAGAVFAERAGAMPA